NEHEERPKCSKTEANEGEKEIDRLNSECLRTGRESIQQAEGGGSR
ncbi:MAG: hypothetical protein H6Q41_1486, partial [Deltaproteobacteria bacterium]|nr:hypothetical protein [Deltaproteobacteria bacterium]